MIKPVRILALLLAMSVAMAPYTPFIGHALVHLLISDHDHHHDDEESGIEHRHHDHQLLFLTALPPARVVSNFKIETNTNGVDFNYFSQLVALSSQNDFHLFLKKGSPPKLRSFLSLSLHAANAPPL